MKRAFDPLHLDVAAFAEDAAALQGQWPLALLPRLAEASVGDPADAPAIAWQVQGEQRPRSGARPEPWLHLRASGSVRLQCQRCLQPVPVDLAAERWFRFVASEAEADAEDPDSEEDVLALSRTLDLRELAEDELILALPLVPRHEVCPEPLPWPATDDEVAAASPFASLAALKKPPSA